MTGIAILTATITERKDMLLNREVKMVGLRDRASAVAGAAHGAARGLAAEMLREVEGEARALLEMKAAADAEAKPILKLRCQLLLRRQLLEQMQQPLLDGLWAIVEGLQRRLPSVEDRNHLG